jgi:hypothetical protein
MTLVYSFLVDLHKGTQSLRFVLIVTYTTFYNSTLFDFSCSSFKEKCFS